MTYDYHAATDPRYTCKCGAMFDNVHKLVDHIEVEQANSSSLKVLYGARQDARRIREERGDYDG